MLVIITVKTLTIFKLFLLSKHTICSVLNVDTVILFIVLHKIVYMYVFFYLFYVARLTYQLTNIKTKNQPFGHSLALIKILKQRRAREKNYLFSEIMTQKDYILDGLIITVLFVTLNFIVIIIAFLHFPEW